MEAEGTARMDQDAERMLRCAAGDVAAFEELFCRYAGKLLGFVDRFFHNRAQSEDVVQETFLRAFRARRSYSAKARFSTWLYTIATRVSLNELRRGRRLRPADVAAETAEAGASPPTPADELAAARLARAVQQATDALPENQRAALLLSRFADRSYAEIAEILGVSEAAVKSLLFRATDELRRVVQQEEGS
jgi:RNA polymerase sigma-70 factor (ECF subfamily)